MKQNSITLDVKTCSRQLYAQEKKTLKLSRLRGQFNGNLLVRLLHYHKHFHFADLDLGVDHKIVCVESFILTFNTQIFISDSNNL